MDQSYFPLLKVLNIFRREVNKSLKNQDVNFYQALIIVTLYAEQKKTFVPTDFVHALGIPKSVVSQSLTKLEEDKLIKRNMFPDDARRTMISLTAKGAKKCVSVMSILDRLDKKIELPFKKSEIKEILSSIRKIDTSSQ
jgi:DNA-binding MarR family transcriptional regulator